MYQLPIAKWSVLYGCRTTVMVKVQEHNALHQNPGGSSTLRRKVGIGGRSANVKRSKLTQPP